MLARKQGHIINISSIGVLASPPRFSAYVASKAALDAFSWCAASEFADSNVRFTTINMPLVRTPMIAPTKLYDAFPALSPDEAAELVMKAVIDKPKRVATGLGLAGRGGAGPDAGHQRIRAEPGLPPVPRLAGGAAAVERRRQGRSAWAAAQSRWTWRASCSRRCSAACTGSW